jgi:hypothetical protein
MARLKPERQPGGHRIFAKFDLSGAMEPLCFERAFAAQTHLSASVAILEAHPG